MTDSTATLLGQPAAYWSDHTAAVEGNPMFDWLLHAGPGWFLVGEIVWCLVFTGFVVAMPGVLSLIVAVAVSTGHTYGSLSWMITAVPIIGLYPVFALFGLAPIAQTILYLRSRGSAPPQLVVSTGGSVDDAAVGRQRPGRSAEA